MFPFSSLFTKAPKEIVIVDSKDVCHKLYLDLKSRKLPVNIFMQNTHGDVIRNPFFSAGECVAISREEEYQATRELDKASGIAAAILIKNAFPDNDDLLCVATRLREAMPHIKLVLLGEDHPSKMDTMFDAVHSETHQAAAIAALASIGITAEKKGRSHV